jgi:ADP-ribose pyrophosphatase YjhB (NUDIX family)
MIFGASRFATLWLGLVRTSRSVQTMEFCTNCGQNLVFEIPAGDNRPRHICRHCGKIHYENPRIVAGCVVTYQDSILLCKRAIEPRTGYWTVPAGFMENGETLPEAAARETLEEAMADVEIGVMSTVVDVVRAHQVHIFFEGVIAEPVFGAGEETLEARLFEPDDIPWSEIAFPSVRMALEHHLSIRESGFQGLRLNKTAESSVS